MLRIILIPLFACLTIILFAQYPSPQIFSRSKYPSCDTQFDLAYGFFLKKYGKSYIENQIFNSYKEAVNHFNERFGTRECDNLIFVKYLFVKQPVQMGLFELQFASEKSATVIEKKLLKYTDGDIKLSIAPDYFIFVKVKKSIFFVSHANDLNTKPIKALAHCLKTFKASQLQK